MNKIKRRGYTSAYISADKSPRALQMVPIECQGNFLLPYIDNYVLLNIVNT